MGVNSSNAQSSKSSAKVGILRIIVKEQEAVKIRTQLVIHNSTSLGLRKLGNLFTCLHRRVCRDSLGGPRGLWNPTLNRRCSVKRPRLNSLRIFHPKPVTLPFRMGDLNEPSRDLELPG